MRVLALVATLAAAASSAAGAFQLRSDDHRLTPLDLTTLPRVSSAVVSPTGAHAVHAVSVQGNSTLYLSSVADPLGHEPYAIRSGPSEGHFWLSDSELAFLDPADQTLKVLALDLSLAPSAIAVSSAEPIVSFPIEVGDLTYHAGSGTLAFTAWVWPDGDLTAVAEHDARFADRGDDGLVYDDLFVRHWDTWRGPKQSQIFHVDLNRANKSSSAKGRWRSSGHFRAPINGTGLGSPSPDALSSFALSATHLLLSAKDPHLSPATHTRRPIYLVPLHEHLGEDIRELTAGGKGATANVRFSPDASRAAWLEMAIDGYEADRNRLVIYELSSGKRHEFAQGWDTARTAFEWIDDDNVLLVASENASSRLYTLPVPRKPTEDDLARQPSTVYATHSASSPVVVRPPVAHAKTQVVFTRSSMSSPPESFIITLPSSHATLVEARPITNFTAAQMAPKRLETPESFTFTGAEGHAVQGWAVKPAGGVDKGKTYPLAFLIHGGPQGAWEDAWSSRWNPQVFASQGYFVVAINPTGSTSFGQAFTDAIAGDWGGRPFRDLLAGHAYALDTWPEIDRERTVALGASYGGYMINWIRASSPPPWPLAVFRGQPLTPSPTPSTVARSEGHNDQFGFKALVCHDGIFSTTDAYYTTEELYFVKASSDSCDPDLRSAWTGADSPSLRLGQRENLGKTPWEDRALYEK